MFGFKSGLLTLEPCNIVCWIYFVSIDAWDQVVIFTRTWTRSGRCKILGHVVFWVELPVQRRLCPIFESDVVLPDIHEYSAG